MLYGAQQMKKDRKYLQKHVSFHCASIRLVCSIICVNRFTDTKLITLVSEHRKKRISVYITYSGRYRL